MSDLSGTGPPWPASDGPPPAAPGEPAALAALAAELPLAPRVWIPAEAEEAFYRLNHLPPRLAALFADVASFDPDEDDVEERAPAARALLAGHALLDAWVDAFYERTRELGDRLRVRRPDAEGRSAGAGRPALLALRRIWAEPWSDEALTARLRASGSVVVEAAPVIVHAADDAPASPELAARIAEILGGPRAAFCLPDGRVTRLGSATRPEREPARG